MSLPEHHARLALEADLSDAERDLLAGLAGLHDKLRRHTRQKYARLNPGYEDLFSWKERAAFWLGEDRNITVYNSATIIGDVDIGDNSWIGPFCLLDGSGGLSIGRYCSVATGCQIVSHDTIKWALSGGVQAAEHARVTIGDCCFLGTHSVITKGVTIGDHCLVAAGAVVSRDVDSYSIVGGVPATVIGRVHKSEDGKVSLEYFERNIPRG